MALCDNDLIMAGAVTTVVSRPGDVFSLQFDTYNAMPHTMSYTNHIQCHIHTPDIICHNNHAT